MTRNRIIFALSILGLLIAIAGAIILGRKDKAQPPVFNPASNPFASGVYANGIVESYQSTGQNINIFPEVSGTTRQILVKEGESVREGTPLLLIDDTVQRANVGQLKAQSEAALTLLQQLRAQPRKEALAVAKAQMDLASANLKTSRDQYNKQKRSYDIDPRSVSKDALDTAANAMNAAQANLDVARRQYELTRAGAWSYEIANQQSQYEALSKAYESASALLDKFTIRAPVDGVVIALNTAVGSYVSSQGVYSTYTQGSMPAVVMSSYADYLGVRCYIDEILINRLPSYESINAQMFIRGTDIRIPLEFVSVQPYVTPKIALSGQRQERVDLRVLPLVFRFRRPEGIAIYPGQMVDVYVEQK